MHRKPIGEILKRERAADILVIADLNSHPTAPSVKTHLRTSGDLDSLRPGVTFNSIWAINEAPDPGTYHHRGELGVIDHVIISPGLLDDAGFSWKRGSTTAIVNDYQMYPAGTPQAEPDRTYGGHPYYGGRSDHLRVGCILQR